MVSSPSSSTHQYEHDVFLSFRGTDTRRNFTSHLYRALDDKGVRTFKDDKELNPGDEIKTLFTALKQSRISIPVFSEDYASSKWCLDEVDEMLQCNKTNNQIIMPIFFYIDPGDVRNQIGSFEKAFKKHEMDFEPARIHKWRKALKEVGSIIGWEHNEVENREQSDLVRLIVERVLSKLDKSYFHVTDHSIGLEPRIKDILSLLNLESMETRFVGICGMGGIGKTTLAKAVYDKIFEKFIGGSSFLAEVRKENKLVDLQNQLLKIIIREPNLINHVDEGKLRIKERLERKTVLLILDDVDHHEQLKALAGDLSWFGAKSRIIITTRDESVLKVGPVVINIYRLEELDKVQSLQLFSWHAFHRDQPLEEFMDLSEEVVKYAGGLPLTLEVLGSFLCARKDVVVWKSALQKLKTIPPKEVQSKLKISFDGLDKMQQAIFLDTACFFVGIKRERVVDMWKACGFHPETELNVLNQKFLLKIDEFDSLRMHDQLQDMGRGIVNEESEPGNRSRLWNAKEIIDVLKNYKGTQMVEVIHLYSPEHEEEDMVSLEAFATMSKLRILRIQYTKIKGNIEYLPSELKWVELEHLGLSDNNWNYERQNKKFRNVKGLKLNHNEFVSPDFSGFPELENLNLNVCGKLVDVQSITKLKRLVRLDLNGCFNLKELPCSICTLCNLKILYLGFTQLEELPNSVERLSKLETLSLKYCRSLTRIHDSIVQMTSLIEIDLSGTLIKGIPDDIGLLEKLKKLYVRDCKYLEYIPKLPSSLIILDACNCHSVTMVPDHSNMRNLREFHLSFNEGMRWSLSGYLDYIGKMESLVVLDMGYSLFKEIPDAIGLLNKLETLSVGDCPYLESVPKLPSSLIVLAAPRCESLERLPDLSNLKKLQTLELRNCKKLGEIQGA